MEKFNGLEELQEIIKGLDRAEIREVYVKEPVSNFYKKQKCVAIWNVDRNELEAIMSDKYVLVQHSDAFFPLIQAVQSFNSEVFGFVNNEGGKVFIDVLFNDDALSINPLDEHKINLGFRASNTYDGSGAFIVQAFAYRGYCQNGMLFGRQSLAQSYQIHRGKVSIAVFTEIMHKLQDLVPLIRKNINSAILDEFEFNELPEILQGYGLGKRSLIKVQEKILENAGLEVKDKLNRWDVYNGITSYISHDLNERIEITRQRYHKIAEKVLITPIASIKRR